jgi:hypothetical protein
LSVAILGILPHHAAIHCTARGWYMLDGCDDDALSFSVCLPLYCRCAVYVGCALVGVDESRAASHHNCQGCPAGGLAAHQTLSVWQWPVAPALAQVAQGASLCSLQAHTHIGVCAYSTVHEHLQHLCSTHTPPDTSALYLRPMTPPYNSAHA